MFQKTMKEALAIFKKKPSIDKSQVPTIFEGFQQEQVENTGIKMSKEKQKKLYDLLLKLNNNTFFYDFSEYYGIKNGFSKTAPYLLKTPNTKIIYDYIKKNLVEIGSSLGMSIGVYFLSDENLYITGTFSIPLLFDIAEIISRFRAKKIVKNMNKIFNTSDEKL